jgi:hypothetical protein
MDELRNDRPSEGDRGPDCLAHLLLDLQGVPLAELHVQGFQAWIQSVCELLVAWERGPEAGLQQQWLGIIASRIFAAYPTCGKTPEDVCTELEMAWLPKAAQDWTEWKARFAPDVPVRSQE